jgi:prepilin-type N-terminal cleavage/methylation domain-containing protein
MSEMKKRLQRKGARKGFTLVELLIVIIIIGILAGGMMLVAGTSRDSAEAARIISDLRTVKSAALMWIVENPMGFSEGNWKELEQNPSPLNKYLDRALDKNTMRFKFEVGTIVQSWDNDNPVGENVWLLGYDLAQGDNYDEVRSGVKKNLENQAKSAGLYGDVNIDFTEEPKGVGFYTADKNIVYVIVQ